jgi:phenylpropionate dioxygenase-like ring-hydroxylating dioxygenase large terminal subunit
MALDKASRTAWQMADAMVLADTREVSLKGMSDPELCALEMETIFAKKWILLGHESEITKRGDFVTRKPGSDGVIVARGMDGSIHVSLNVCPHHGMRVCTVDSGNAMMHRCIYHGWAFRPDGSFIGAPVGREQMHGNIRQKSEPGLIRAKVHLYRGFVFATWNEKALVS